MHPSIHAFTQHPFIHPSIHASIYLFVEQSINLSTHQSVYPSICPSVHLSICPSVHRSICLSVYLSICGWQCLPCFHSRHGWRQRSRLWETAAPFGTQQLQDSLRFSSVRQPSLISLPCPFFIASRCSFMCSVRRSHKPRDGFHNRNLAMSTLAIIPILIFSQFLRDFETVFHFSFKPAELPCVVLYSSMGGIHATQHSFQS